MRSLRKVSLAVLVVCGVAVAASAQQRVFVSAAQGNDANPCSVTLPCRSFAHAMMVVSTDGEILALDSGGYGAVSIAKAVSIVGPLGVEASITQGASMQDAIDINTSGNVVLRGLSIFGLGSGNHGINIAAATTVSVQSCNINGFAGNGINYNVMVAGILTVTNSTVNSNYTGVEIIASSNDLAKFEIDHTRLENNFLAGIHGHQGSRGTIRDSFLSGAYYGVDYETASGGQTSLLQIENCALTLNSINGIAVFAPGGITTVRVSDTLIAHNGHGLVSNDANAHIWTRLNNTLEDNITGDGAFTDTFSAK